MRLQHAEWKMHPSNSPLRAYDDLSIQSIRIPGEHLEIFRQVVVLADGGIADNLAVVPLWRELGDLFISDGGGTPSPESRP